LLVDCGNGLFDVVSCILNVESLTSFTCFFVSFGDSGLVRVVLEGMRYYAYVYGKRKVYYSVFTIFKYGLKEFSLLPFPPVFLL